MKWFCARTLPAGAAANVVLRGLRGEVIVLWDGGSSHKGEPVHELLAADPRLSIEAMPAYTAQLNPVEFPRSYLKYDRLANFVPEDLLDLEHRVQVELHKLKLAPALLKSLWMGSELSFPTGTLFS